MNKIKDIPIWENKRRLGLLKEFRKQIMYYFKNSQPRKFLSDYRIETKRAVDARSQINLKKLEIHDIVSSANVPFNVLWQQPTITGDGDITNIDLIHNIFDLDQHEMAPNRVIDVIDQAIGVYQFNQRKSLIRTCNPVWWAGLAIKWVASFPFWLLDAAGYDGQKASDSHWGRVTRLVIEVVTVLIAIWELLDVPKLFDTVKKLWE